MRFLLVDPGAPFSVSDVYTGIAAALRRDGHEVIAYDLTGRLDFASSYLTMLWEQRAKDDPAFPPPTDEDIVYLACQGVLERATWYQPDAVLITSALWFPPPAIIDLRRCGYFVGALLTESPYNDVPQAKVAALANVAWTNERTSVDVLRAANPHVFYLPAAFDSERHRDGGPIPEAIPTHDVVMVGTGFPERVALLEGVDWTGIDLGLYGTWSWDERNDDGEMEHMGIPETSPLFPYVKSGPIPNEMAVNLYRRAKIGLNLYRTCVEFTGVRGHVFTAESMNPRAYELAACGAFTLSDERAESREKFGELIPTFRNAAEFERLIRYYLAHDQERASIAARLPAAVAGETFDARAAQIVADIERVKGAEGERIEPLPRKIREGLPQHGWNGRRSPAQVH